MYLYCDYFLPENLSEGRNDHKDSPGRCDNSEKLRQDPGRTEGEDGPVRCDEHLSSFNQHISRESADMYLDPKTPTDQLHGGS